MTRPTAAFTWSGVLLAYIAVARLAAQDAALAVPTWAHDVAPILMNRCVECHRPGQVAPFSLIGYRDAAKRAKFIARAVNSRAMPPWSPDAPAHEFVGDRTLSAQEIATLTRWAEAGAPEGDPSAAPPVPAPPDEGWHLGRPDLVLRMRRPFSIPAGPSDTYQVFPIPFSLGSVAPDVLAAARIPDSEYLAVAAIEIHPGNVRSLHHADVFIDTSGVARKREANEGGNGYTSFGTPGFVPAAYLGGRVPGLEPQFLPPGIAACAMPMHGDVVLQVHYAATGKVETDQTEIGIYFMREPARRIMDSLFLRSFKIDIPPGAAAYTLEDSIEIPADCALMTIFPHMHLLGREVHAVAHLPDGTVRTLIDITRWNFRWQARYYYREPFVLPKGTVVHCRWVFDNSAANRSNPFSPPREVRFGPNSTDEMCELQLGVIPMNLGDEARLMEARVRKMREKIAELSPAEKARFHWEDAFNDLAGRN